MFTCNRVIKFCVIILTLFAVSKVAHAQPRMINPVILIDYSTAPRFLWEQFAEAQSVYNERFLGYRGDLPRALLAQLSGVKIAVGFDFIDEPGNILAFAGPRDVVTFGSAAPSFYSQVRPFAFTKIAEMTIDIDDIDYMLAEDIFVDVVVHEAMHAVGFGTLFEANGLNGITNLFGQRNYNFDGFALRKYRVEAQAPFATYIPLYQQDGGGHWSPFDPFFYQPENGIYDVMLPFAPPPGFQPNISETTWSVFADLGYSIRGVNAPGQ